MAQTITLTQSEYKSIVNRIKRLESIVSEFLKSVEKEPKYGSDAWWEWSDRLALKEIERGEYYELKGEKDIDEFFAHLGDEEYVYNRFHPKGKKKSSKAIAFDSEKISKAAQASL